ncbi:MAG: hypothetical protein JSR46_10850 [Verrucomicrobia bacterium]|nr:hypothetical protein [Verrucomicrobiota bacterium]
MAITASQAPLFPDPLTQDNAYLNAFDRASIRGDQKQAEQVLESFHPEVPTVAKALHKISKQYFILKEQYANTEFELVPLEKEITSHNLTDFLLMLQGGASYRAKTKEGEPLSHLALREGQTEMLHMLLQFRVDPNEKDKAGKTLLKKAQELGNIGAAYLLIAYGAKYTTADVSGLMQIAKTHDPLYVSTRDTLLAAAAVTYYLAKTVMSSHPFLEAIPILTQTWALFDVASPASNRAIWALGLTALQLLPITNIATQMGMAASVAYSCFSGLKAAYNNFSLRPLRSIVKGAIVSINAFQACSLFKNTTAREISENELLQSLQTCHNITTDDITALDIRTPADRMSWLLAHPHAYKCAPILEHSFSCDTFKALYHKASLTYHPDKSSAAGSSIQTILYAVKSAWKSRCIIK